ncbi:MAG: MATE family efflux transporter [Clostridia bacterium]
MLKLTIPAVAAQIINMLYNIVDRIYIGHMSVNGDLALTGVGVCLPIIMIISAFAALVSMGGAPRASMFMGKGDYKSAQKTLSNCFSLQIVVSAVLTVILLIWNRPILLAFGASAETIQYASGYMFIYAIGTVFVQLTLGMNAFITAQGFAKISMLTVVVGAVANIILDPIFIYGFNMGVEGAALATIISQAISTAWIIFFLVGKKTILKLNIKNMIPTPKIILPCLALGLAPFIMQASESILFICFNTSLYQYGGNIAVGAMTILTSVMQFTMLPLQGFSQGAQPISSYNFGARNGERVKKTFYLLLKICVIYSTVLWALIMLFPQMFAKMFTPVPELIEYTKWALRIYMSVSCIMGIQIACQMTFISIGNATSSIIVALVRKFATLIPLIYILPQIITNQVMAVYLAEPIADVIAITFTVCLFAVQFKRALKKLDMPEKLANLDNPKVV